MGYLPVWIRETAAAWGWCAMIVGMAIAAVLFSVWLFLAAPIMVAFDLRRCRQDVLWHHADRLRRHGRASFDDLAFLGSDPIDREAMIRRGYPAAEAAKGGE